MRRLTLLYLLFFFSFGLVTAQHLKKDGTPDRRYKENRSSYSSSPSSSSPSSSYTYTPASTSHLKKDGTPDRRYKENKGTSYTPSVTVSKRKTYNNYPAERDRNGKIKRSSAAKHEFMKQSGYPKGRRGYVVDHIVPLKKGGCDCPENMQWQTVQ
jgi:hypothetical protein